MTEKDPSLVLAIPEEGIQPKQVRYIDQNTEPILRDSAFPSNSSVLINKEQIDRSLLIKTFTIILIIVIILIFLVWLESIYRPNIARFN